jgi:hypothetical protein
LFSSSEIENKSRGNVSRSMSDDNFTFQVVFSSVESNGDHKHSSSQ